LIFKTEFMMPRNHNRRWALNLLPGCERNQPSDQIGWHCQIIEGTISHEMREDKTRQGKRSENSLRMIGYWRNGYMDRHEGCSSSWQLEPFWTSRSYSASFFRSNEYR
jgi:hypothetical protein